MFDRCLLISVPFRLGVVYRHPTKLLLRSELNATSETVDLYTKDGYALSNKRSNLSVLRRCVALFWLKLV
ncbi:hypothetical protein C7B69_11665 [filamentous cyanobacterium Phorm 46]|nr:hypothetical protein C7B69_11665 [filamentous cyanobacterium Phorm 46]PSB53486.1 hypothetical protein C7B67_02795 [filamentous cyanobacterium Phorm 6]